MDKSKAYSQSSNKLNDSKESKASMDRKSNVTLS